MSQHLITQFINRTYVFKPFGRAKFANHRLKKYQSSNRNNNSSPEDVAESTHNMQKIKAQAKEKENKQTELILDEHIDITV